MTQALEKIARLPEQIITVVGIGAVVVGILVVLCDWFNITKPK